MFLVSRCFTVIHVTSTDVLVFDCSFVLCSRMFVVQQIPDSNLVLVVAQADCDCSRQYGAILLEPKEIKYILH